MSQSDVFHLGLTKNDLQGAQLAIVPGDPQRVEKIAKLMENPVHLASHREFTTWRAELDGKAVIVCSTGIGGPSTSIAVEELAQLGIRTFLRIGTTGAIQANINVGDVLVTTAAVRLDGASLHFAPMEFPAVADFACTTALVEAAKASGATTHIGWPSSGRKVSGCSESKGSTVIARSSSPDITACSTDSPPSSEIFNSIPG